MSTSKDWTGQKFNRLTLLEVDPDWKPGDGTKLWLAKCDCGKTVKVIPCRVRAGHVKSCGCLVSSPEHRAFASIIGATQGNRQYEPIISSARIVWGTVYKDLSFEDFYRLSQENCYYCGRAPYKTFNVANKKPSKHRGTPSEHQRTEGNFIYNGIDRIDNNLGHIIDNVVPCCSECNYMKGKLSRSEFLKHIMLIGAHLVRSEVMSWV